MQAKKTTSTALVLAIMATVTLADSGASASNRSDAATPRQQEVTEKGAMVMPFNVHNSTHVFEKTADGGLQQVVAKDATDTDLVNHIRRHLSMEAARFKQGDYSDPMAIHGMDMPGVQYLSSVKPDKIAISYRELPNGAEIRYTSMDTATVEAIHRWFDAQLSDHGGDATDRSPSH